jgi:protein-tyrosine phosphatase
VLLAHPERSPAYARRPEPLIRLLEHGVLAQVTGGAFTGEFGGTVRRTAFAMLEHGLVHVIASDAHDANHRPPTLRRAQAVLEGRYADGREQFEWLAVGAPEALLAERSLPRRPAAPRVKGGRLRRFIAG